VRVLTDFPERFDGMQAVFIGTDDRLDAYGVKAVRWHKQNVLLTLAGVTTRTQAEALKGRYLKIPAEEAMPLEPDSFYHHQLLGLSVQTEDGRFFGSTSQKSSRPGPTTCSWFATTARKFCYPPPPR